MSKQESLCSQCRSHMSVEVRTSTVPTTFHSCKKGLCKDESHFLIISCSEFDNINPGVTINAFPSKFQSDWADFLVQANGKVENELYSSFEDAMQAATVLLKRELEKQKEEVS